MARAMGGDRGRDDEAWLARWVVIAPYKVGDRGRDEASSRATSVVIALYKVGRRGREGGACGSGGPSRACQGSRVRGRGGQGAPDRFSRWATCRGGPSRTAAYLRGKKRVVDMPDRPGYIPRPIQVAGVTQW